MEKIIVSNVARYRVTASTSPHVGVSVQITAATPQGERDLPAFWLPPDAARSLAAALVEQANKARSRN